MLAKSGKPPAGVTFMIHELKGKKIIKEDVPLGQACMLAARQAAYSGTEEGR
jgi:hypothetical protein